MIKLVIFFNYVAVVIDIIIRLQIIFGCTTILSIASCREYHPHHRENVPLRRYKDTKNKRGVGDYPYGLSFGGQSFPGFQSPPPPPAGVSLGGGFAGFGGFQGGSPLGLSSNPFGLSAPSPSFSSFGSPGLGSLGSYNSLSQPFNLGQNSGFSLSGSGVNFASLLGGQGSTATSYSSPSVGLFSPSSDKTGPVTFGAQGAAVSQAQQYMPVYATTTQLGSNSFSSPSILSSSQGPSIQAYSQQTPLSISSLLSGNGVSYSAPSSSSSADLASHSVTKNYVIAAAPQTEGTAQSYSVPFSALTSSSSPSYSVSKPPSYRAANMNFAASLPAAMYQLAISPSSYSTSPLSSSSNHYTKYVPISSDGSTYLNKSPVSTYSAAIKLSGYANPSMMYEAPSKTMSQQASSSGTNYAAPSQSVTSYGTPVVMYSIPSTSYGTPNQPSPSSSTQYTSSSSGNASPSVGYAAASSYLSASSSSSHQTDSLQKSPVNNNGSPATTYQLSNSNYGSSTGSPAQSNSISGYKIQLPSSASTFSNSIDNFSTGSQPSTHSHGVDSSSSYSNHAPRYIRYPVSRPSKYLDSDDEEPTGNSYDTISYSVPSEKY